VPGIQRCHIYHWLSCSVFRAADPALLQWPGSASSQWWLKWHGLLADDRADSLINLILQENVLNRLSGRGRPIVSIGPRLPVPASAVIRSNTSFVQRPKIWTTKAWHLFQMKWEDIESRPKSNTPRIIEWARGSQNNRQSRRFSRGSQD
jgi:hypothetical protein